MGTQKTKPVTLSIFEAKHRLTRPSRKQAVRIIGGAGTGKTTELLRILELVLQRTQDPTKVGFLTMTRSARRDASTRAAERFNLEVDALEQDGWFRTLHSVAFKVLGCKKGDVIGNDRTGEKWMAQCFSNPHVTSTGEWFPDGNTEPSLVGDKTDEGRALLIWAQARCSLKPVKDVWQRARRIDGYTPSLDFVTKTIDHYEQSKRLDGMMDFTDLLGRAGGIHFDIEGQSETAPDGQIPQEVRAWILDEAQDTTPLSGRLFHRLIEGDGCDWAYLSGDPMQAIFTFAGSDHRVMMGWPVVKEIIQPQSHRCPPEVFKMGEQILRRCSDYFDRGIKPADHRGLAAIAYLPNILNTVAPGDDWLILARANYLVKRLAASLDYAGTPWRALKGKSTWDASSRNHATQTLLAMEKGHPASLLEWKTVLGFIKARRKIGGESPLVHGTQARFAEMSRPQLEDAGWAGPEDWQSKLGVAPALAELIRSKQWRHPTKMLVPYADRYYRAVSHWGYDAPEKTRIRVGTIHAAKGAEADNVLLLTTTTQRCVREAESCPDNADAEHRVWYVGATRARHELLLCREDAVEQGRKPEYRV